MKTRQGTCVFIVCLLLLACPLFAAAQTAGANQSASAAASAGDQSGITGEWQGMISRYNILIKIDRTPGDALAARLTIASQNAVPFSKVSFTPDKVLRLELGNGAVVIEGKLNDQGTEINGTWQESGNAAPLVLRRPGAAALPSH